jgi:hypothetical protein
MHYVAGTRYILAFSRYPVRHSHDNEEDRRCSGAHIKAMPMRTCCLPGVEPPRPHGPSLRRILPDDSPDCQNTPSTTHNCYHTGECGHDHANARRRIDMAMINGKLHQSARYDLRVDVSNRSHPHIPGSDQSAIMLPPTRARAFSP